MRLTPRSHRGTARNFNPDAAGAGKICIAEVEEVVEAGTFDAADIHLPGIYVDRIIVNPNPEKRIEVRSLLSLSLSLSLFLWVYPYRSHFFACTLPPCSTRTQTQIHECTHAAPDHEEEERLLWRQAP